MKRLGQLAVALAIIALAASAVWAQGPRGGGGGLFLLTQKSVQEELKLSDDQLKKVGELVEKQREEFGKLRDLSREERQKKVEELTKESHKALAEILKADQVKRFKQIQWQQEGARAFADPEVADALKLSDEQKDKVKAVREEAQKEMRALRESGASREEVRKKFEEIRKASSDKLMGILTDEQKTKWKELQGEPFKGEIQRPGAGGGAGRRRAGGRLS
jgi:Spy/CpxP family protein refolding chaperone